MRTETMQTLLSQLPADLRGVIKAVNKKASAGNKLTTITTSSDKLWLFSEVEIDNTTTATYSSEGVQYNYWKTIKDGTVAANRIKKRNGSADYWWLRSPNVTYTTNFRYIYSDGLVYDNFAGYAIGVSFGFCV